MKKVELLSPAGGYETMVGAFNAGADAVYLGGSKFGARAYADNFDRDQVLDAISYAHLNGKKIYMTVNTLVKESEYSELYDFMLPYAEKKLDGVIVQDYGVMRLIRNEFPKIELHASTQQAVTGVHSARLLKERGFTRVVPARELSLDEMRAIRQEADIEVEAFIHGAMCYCYSGMCLFSSAIGGRSGNRGRCAQPCRLPYRTPGDKGEIYPLSLKDMSTIGIIPDLIKAGIDSFKIEGRMKKPEYSAGVTALYRKYIDKYYEDPEGGYSISRDDLDTLKSLYQRTGISEGYYFRHNDRSMVTVSSPAYNATSPEILEDVRKTYLAGTLKQKVRFNAFFKVSEPARLEITYDAGGEEITAESRGNIVQAAQKRPMDEDAIREKLGKLGGTDFEAESISVIIDDGGSGTGIFMPVGDINNLRRDAVALLEDKIRSRMAGGDSGECIRVSTFTDYDYYGRGKKGGPLISVLVSTSEQLEAVLMRAEEGNSIRNLFVDCNVFLSADNRLCSRVSGLRDSGCFKYIYAALPHITRTEDFDGVKEVMSVVHKLEETSFDGALVRNLEQLGALRESDFSGRVVLDYSIYTWNSEAALEMLDLCRGEGRFMIEELSVPYELSFHEAKDTVRALRKKCAIPVSYNIYGRIPMMISAGCIKKTTGHCSGRMHEIHSESTGIIDRMNNFLPVTAICRSCYNVIWNPHPVSLHNTLSKISDGTGFDSLRIDFSVEDKGRTLEVLDFYEKRLRGEECPDIFQKIKFTTGHFKRGAE